MISCQLEQIGNRANFVLSPKELHTLLFKKLKLTQDQVLGYDSSNYKELRITVTADVDIEAIATTVAIVIRPGELRMAAMKELNKERTVKLQWVPLDMVKEDIVGAMTKYGRLLWEPRRLTLGEELSEEDRADEELMMLSNIISNTVMVDMEVEINIPSFIKVGGSKVKVTYQGQQTNCGRCFRHWKACPGEGKSANCAAKEGPKVDFDDWWANYVINAPVPRRLRLRTTDVINTDKITLENVSKDLNKDQLLVWFAEICQMEFRNDQLELINDLWTLVTIGTDNTREVVKRIDGKKLNNKTVIAVPYQNLDSPAPATRDRQANQRALPPGPPAGETGARARDQAGAGGPVSDPDPYGAINRPLQQRHTGRGNQKKTTETNDDEIEVTYDSRADDTDGEGETVPEQPQQGVISRVLNLFKPAMAMQAAHDKKNAANTSVEAVTKEPEPSKPASKTVNRSAPTESTAVRPNNAAAMSTSVHTSPILTRAGQMVTELGLGQVRTDITNLNLDNSVFINTSEIYPDVTRLERGAAGNSHDQRRDQDRTQGRTDNRVTPQTNVPRNLFLNGDFLNENQTFAEDSSALKEILEKDGPFKSVFAEHVRRESLSRVSRSGSVDSNRRRKRSDEEVDQTITKKRDDKKTPPSKAADTLSDTTDEDDDFQPILTKSQKKRLKKQAKLDAEMEMKAAKERRRLEQARKRAAEKVEKTQKAAQDAQRAADALESRPSTSGTSGGSGAGGSGGKRGGRGGGSGGRGGRGGSRLSKSKKNQSQNLVDSDQVTADQE